VVLLLLLPPVRLPVGLSARSEGVRKRMNCAERSWGTSKTKHSTGPSAPNCRTVKWDFVDK
jgi:hypothetical protein